MCCIRFALSLQKIKPIFKDMSREELRSYRLNSMEEPTDEMLEAIMLGVQDLARQSTIRAKAELDRRFEEAKAEIARRRVINKELYGRGT